MRRRIAFGLIGLALLGGAIGWAKRAELGMALFERTVERNMARDVVGGLDPKGLHVAFCGTGSPVPSRDRGEACTAVIAGGRLFIFDAGEGAARTLSMMGLPLGKTEGVWLTHLHSDHFQGLGNLGLQRWAGTSAATPLTVFGPEGVKEVTDGLTAAFRLDSTYRIAHHGEATIPPSGFGLVGTAVAPGVVYDRNGVRITAFLVNHAPISPAYGYRVDYQGKSVTISGDTAPTPGLVAAAKGTDLLVMEVLSKSMVRTLSAQAAKAGQPGRSKIMADILNYHTSPEDAADMAKAAGAKQLAFTHIVPSIPRFMEAAFMGDAASRYDGPILIMRDGDLVSIAGDRPERKNLLP